MQRQHRFPRELRDKENRKANRHYKYKGHGGREGVNGLSGDGGVIGAAYKLMTHPYPHSIIFSFPVASTSKHEWLSLPYNENTFKKKTN